MTGEEARHHLSRIARGTDKTLAIRAMDVLHRLEQAEIAKNPESLWDFSRLAAEYLSHPTHPELCWSLAWTLYVSNRDSIPERERVEAVMSRNFPQIWKALGALPRGNPLSDMLEKAKQATEPSRAAARAEIR